METSPRAGPRHAGRDRHDPPRGERPCRVACPTWRESTGWRSAAISSATSTPRRWPALFPGKLLYTLRSRAEGGGSEGSPERRRQRLIEAGGRYDLVDLEAARDLTPDILEGRAAREADDLLARTGRRRRRSHRHLRADGRRSRRALQAGPHGRAGGGGGAGAAAARLARPPRRRRFRRRRHPAPGRGWWPRASARRSSMARSGRCRGRRGRSRSSACGATTACRSCRRSRRCSASSATPSPTPSRPASTTPPTARSGIPALYLPFHADSFGDFWLEVVENAALEAIGSPLRGLVGRPRRTRRRRWRSAAAVSPLAQPIGAANTLVCNQGRLGGRVHRSGRRRLASRATAACASRRHGGGGGRRRRRRALGGGGPRPRAGARVTLFNRDPERGKSSAAHLQAPFPPARDLDPSRFDLLVNATSLGRGADDPLRFPSRLRAGAVVIDLVYFPDRPTRLLLARPRRAARWRSTAARCWWIRPAGSSG